MNTIKIFRPAFLNPLCEVFGLPIGSFCLISRRSFDGQRDVWAVALDYQGRRFPHIVMGGDTGCAISGIKIGLKSAVKLIQRAFLLPEFAKYVPFKEHALLCGAIELDIIYCGLNKIEGFLTPEDLNE